MHQVAAAVAMAAAVAVVDDEDGVQWWQRGGAFNGGGSVRRQQQQRWGLRIWDDEATMKIDISGGGWRRRALAFDSGDGRRWALAFDSGDGRWQLWQRWTIETAFNGGGDGCVRYCSSVRWCLMASAMNYDQRARGRRKDMQSNNQPAQ